MRKQDGAAAALGLHALDDVLPEGIVGAALGRRAVDVPAPRIGGPGIAIPLLDGVRRIGQDHIELHEPVAFDKGGMGQGIAPDDAEVLDAVQEQVHPADGRGEQVALLAEQPQVAPLLVLPLQMGDGGEQHARRTAGGIIDRLARLGFEHLGHQVDHGAVGIELRSGVAGIVGKLLDQKLVAHAQLILRAVGERKRLRAEVLDQLAQHVVRQAVLVGPLGIAEDSVQGVGVGRLNGPQGILDGLAHVLDLGAGGLPVSVLRDLEAVLFGQRGVFLIAAGFLQRIGQFLVIHVAQALVEQQREDELLVVPGVDVAAQQGGRAPEVGFESDWECAYGSLPNVLVSTIQPSRNAGLRSSQSC